MWRLCIHVLRRDGAGIGKKSEGAQRTTFSTTERRTPFWDCTTALHTGFNKRKRQLVEAAYIATKEVTNHRDGFVNLSCAVANLVLTSQSGRSPTRRPMRGSCPEV
ncbi:hypothetical protein E2C01_081453 [Portunus trituberculatus]|uniref:Uncharacterized protein n=1 Tax=Portunus trituberculatus TaxID=210409 RepID=A0A5B7IYV8_PORTR|nr:hypothetical protein [Portunus trituberculatus]